MHPDDTNVYATSLLDKYENRPDELEQLCLADFGCNYVSKKGIDVQVVSEDIKSYTVSVSSISDLPPSQNYIVLKMKWVKCENEVDLVLCVFTKFLKLKAQKSII